MAETKAELEERLFSSDPIYWFAELVKHDEAGNFAEADRAQKKLRSLGWVAEKQKVGAA